MIHIFAPFRIQSEPSRRACVRIEPGSEPASGSVSPKQPMTSPRCIGGSQRSFCSSEPKRQIGNIASEPCTETALLTPASPGLELHAGQPVGDRARAGQAVAVEVHAVEAELGELGEELAREDPLLEPVAHVREDVLAHELPDGVSDRLLLVVEELVDREVVEGIEGGELGRSWSPWPHPTRRGQTEA